MAEITYADEAAVATFLNGEFGVPGGLARSYAHIAVRLSDLKDFAERLKRVDAWLAAIYEAAMANNAFGAPANEGAAREAPGPKREGFNVTSRLLNAAANSLGWGTHGNLVMSGFSHPADFVRLVQNKRMWKDMVASGHGEFTHILQWLVIRTIMHDDAPALYAGSCDYSVQGRAYRNGQKAYLWDFIVDCYPSPPPPDWMRDMRSATPRSPTIANARIFETPFLGGRLKARYASEKRKWTQPSDSTPAYPGTSRYSHARHLPADPEKVPVGVEDDALRTERVLFQGKKGYQGLVSTGHPQGNVKDKPGRMGYLFARSDKALQPESTLMQIAQSTRLA